MEREALNAFKDVIHYVEEVRKNKTGGFSIRQRQFGFQYETSDHPVIKKYGLQSFASILGEVTNITLQILNNNTELLIENLPEKTPEAKELLQRKIELIHERIIDDRLIREYHFLNNCTTAALKGLSLQSVIKPTKPGYPDVISIISRFDIHDNKPESKETSIVFEISPDQLDDVIKGLIDAKNKALQLEETRNAEGKIEHIKAKLQ